METDVKVVQETIDVRTEGAGLIDVTSRIQSLVSRAGVRRGLCSVYLRHTSASLLIQENADPRVLSDLEDFFAELVPESRRWAHDDEGPDDMPAHVRAALTHTNQSIPITDGRLGLGTWQGLYLWEHRRRGHTRKLIVTLIGS